MYKLLLLLFLLSIHGEYFRDTFADTLRHDPAAIPTQLLLNHKLVKLDLSDQFPLNVVVQCLTLNFGLFVIGLVKVHNYFFWLRWLLRVDSYP